MTVVLLAVVAVVLALVLVGLLRALDFEQLRDHPEGLLSVNGVLGVCAGGFLAGVAWGAVHGINDGSPVAEWVGRALIDGLLVADAGAFYLGFQQRRREHGGPG